MSARRKLHLCIDAVGVWLALRAGTRVGSDDEKVAAQVILTPLLAELKRRGLFDENDMSNLVTYVFNSLDPSNTLSQVTCRKNRDKWIRKVVKRAKMPQLPERQMEAAELLQRNRLLLMMIDSYLTGLTGSTGDPHTDENTESNTMSLCSSDSNNKCSNQNSVIVFVSPLPADDKERVRDQIFARLRAAHGRVQCLWAHTPHFSASARTSNSVLLTGRTSISLAAHHIGRSLIDVTARATEEVLTRVGQSGGVVETRFDAAACSEAGVWQLKVSPSHGLRRYRIDTVTVLPLEAARSGHTDSDSDSDGDSDGGHNDRNDGGHNDRTVGDNGVVRALHAANRPSVHSITVIGHVSRDVASALPFDVAAHTFLVRNK
ncbi:MAG: hypothetical protein MHM6MM_008118, partial [Cercozoa sp. M6MM]